MIRYTVAAASLCALAACAPMDGASRADPSLAGPAVRVVGEAESCINRSRIRHTLIRSDQVIDFEMSGGKVYRNVLTRPCPRLGFEQAITYDSSIDQFCRPELIYVLDRVGGGLQRGAGCGLGDFVPVEYLEDGEDD